MRRLAVPFLLAAVLTGCSSPEPGKPSAGDQTGSAPTTGTSAGSAPVNRPKAVDLKTLDPCSLITPGQKTALGLKSATAGTPLPDYGEGSKSCNVSFDVRTYLGTMHTLLNGGADRLKKTVGESKLTSLQVAGYPAYLTQRESPGSVGGCEVYIDANEGQLLLVDAFGGLGETSATTDGACERAKAVAGAVAVTLAAK
ncbi:DUF3558 domain-containing protein [Lentzea sp. NBC_00516]|uniref:DUF3558 domain-containing protein n=1 Tax=Lentzea sp. NBC_00516 TaxID=2903582 RepID=UPI002E822BB7|nr:DUF3558 domain-containing protein [Lentzea sp. NBC_00516]WUD23090.1 DUF3558 domain-containing protein [Lentzea sp. NBC_00516]